MWVARLLAEMGCTVIAVSDVQGGVYREHGIDIDQLLEHQGEAGTVTGLKGTDALTNDELLELDCDFLVPAAVNGVIHREQRPARQGRSDRRGGQSPVDPRGR